MTLNETQDRKPYGQTALNESETKETNFQKRGQDEMDNFFQDSTDQDRRDETNIENTSSFSNNDNGGVGNTFSMNEEPMDVVKNRDINNSSVSGAETPPMELVKKKRGRRKKEELSPGKSDFENQFTLRENRPVSMLPPNLRMEDLRLSQDFYSDLNVIEIPSAIEYRKPNKREFIRVSPAENNQITVGVIKDKQGMREKIWIVNEIVRKKYSDEVVPINLRLAINLKGQVFIWPLSLPNMGNTNSWVQSALVAAETAKTQCVRVIADTSAGRYRVQVAKGNLHALTWPEMDFWEAIQLAFKDSFLVDLNHPFLKELDGEI